ncbi:hypothetical protein CHS0354_037756 [Potamilus streckersoni]|uniref:Uncharacterized protein n=1 Tax=Potamilus streckersoni TaxID=2493646 RepID=A0AAE0T3C3_9BIVA|nr:hypothetical protein CHS0354_037756 [Potamilus streckersoni]
MERYLTWLVIVLVYWAVLSADTSSRKNESIAPPNPLLFSDHELEPAIQQALSVGHGEFKEQKTLNELLHRQGVDENNHGRKMKWCSIHQMADSQRMKQPTYIQTEQTLISIRAAEELTRILSCPLVIYVFVDSVHEMVLKGCKVELEGLLILARVELKESTILSRPNLT